MHWQFLKLRRRGFSSVLTSPRTGVKVVHSGRPSKSAHASFIILKRFLRRSYDTVLTPERCSQHPHSSAFVCVLLCQRCCLSFFETEPCALMTAALRQRPKNGAMRHRGNAFDSAPSRQRLCTRPLAKTPTGRCLRDGALAFTP